MAETKTPLLQTEAVVATIKNGDYKQLYERLQQVPLEQLAFPKVSEFLNLLLQEATLASAKAEVLKVIFLRFLKPMEAGGMLELIGYIAGLIIVPLEVLTYVMTTLNLTSIQAILEYDLKMRKSNGGPIFPLMADRLITALGGGVKITGAIWEELKVAATIAERQDALPYINAKLAPLAGVAELPEWVSINKDELEMNPALFDPANWKDYVIARPTEETIKLATRIFTNTFANVAAEGADADSSLIEDITRIAVTTSSSVEPEKVEVKMGEAEGKKPEIKEPEDEQVEGEKPETEKLETEKLETKEPEDEQVEGEKPETEEPETKKPEVEGEEPEIKVEKKIYPHPDRIFGPVNVILDRECISGMAGGCRMLTCCCRNFNQDEDDELDTDPSAWFSGNCDNCTARILNISHALRQPVLGGGWVGCYCCVECVTESPARVLDNMAMILLNRILDQLSDKGIFNRLEPEEVDSEPSILNIKTAFSADVQTAAKAERLTAAFTGRKLPGLAPKPRVSFAVGGITPPTPLPLPVEPVAKE